MAALKLENVRKSYGEVEVIKGVNIDIEDGEFVGFVGPSGCGKSTLLRMVAGLEDITSGSLTIDGDVVNSVEPKDRGIAMVFQSYAIFPHMTVRENVAFGLTINGASKEEKAAKVAEAARILQMENLLDRRLREIRLPMVCDQYGRAPACECRGHGGPDLTARTRDDGRAPAEIGHACLGTRSPTRVSIVRHCVSPRG